MRLRFLDANILLYAISSAADEQAKRKIAVQLVAPLDWQCSAQVLQEFYVNAVNPRKGGISAEAATTFSQSFTLLAKVATDAQLVLQATRISQTEQVSHWDAAVIAAAQRCGATELLTEDLNGGQRFGPVTIVNTIA
jgi:predicted nucleic acid-binding protein